MNIPTMDSKYYATLSQAQQSLVKWQYRTHGSFFTTLWKVIALADNENLMRLAKGYPELVREYQMYTGTTGYWRSIDAKLFPGKHEEKK